MNAVLNIDYTAVLARHRPKVIRTEAENDHFTAVLYELDQRSESLSPAERKFADRFAIPVDLFSK